MWEDVHAYGIHKYYAVYIRDLKSWLTGKDPNAGRDWGKEKKGTTEMMPGWHHQLYGHEFE